MCLARLDCIGYLFVNVTLPDKRFNILSSSYFDGRGFAEVPRTLFATVGRFAGQGFTDVRLDSVRFLLPFPFSLYLFPTPS